MEGARKWSQATVVPLGAFKLVLRRGTRFGEDSGTVVSFHPAADASMFSNASLTEKA